MKELYQLPLGDRMRVSSNDVGQPIGTEARVLSCYLGIIARNASLLPINYESWREMPNSNKIQVVDCIKVIISLKEMERSQEFLKKNYFKNNLNLEEKLQNIPSGMLRYQWEDTVRFWSSKKGKEITSGNRVGRIKLFEMTHTKKKIALLWLLKLQKLWKKLSDKRVEYEATASSNASINSDEIENQVIAEVFGPKRYGRLKLKREKQREQREK
ncbi:uncharacterized protein LOC120122172 [Hibiscus syriacus]|uniref:uncharacterized protein LOC120122172 n=1 Tax=Hibiscus syriacus TaxID=106335 RepID=UPI001924DEE3|nr:uncharacterized protein LOC120122172 [Hibiscus syriacus]